MNGLSFDPTKWREELHAWAYRFGSIPEALLATCDRSESYEMDRAHVFKIWPGRYALVLEQGCSCYVYEEADIYLYGDEKSVMEDYTRWLGTPSYKFEPTGNKFTPAGVEAKEEELW